MPAKDNNHDVVARCLRRTGYTILDEQVYVSIGTSPKTLRRLYIDMQVQLESGLRVLVEVKSLSRSPIHQLMQLLGQYLVYRTALDYLDIRMQLYVAVSEKDHDNMTQSILGQQVISRYAIPLLIYDPEYEVIREWIPAP